MPGIHRRARTGALLERHHNDRFAALMDQYLPDWRLRRDLLDKSPLAHEAWEY